MNELRIQTIADLQLHVRHRGKVPIRGFNQIYAMALQALPGNSPSFFKDHRKAKNPYHLRYGEGWVEKLKSSKEMSKFVCITKLIRFMMDEAEKLVKGVSARGRFRNRPRALSPSSAYLLHPS